MKTGRRFRFVLAAFAAVFVTLGASVRADDKPADPKKAPTQKEQRTEQLRKWMQSFVKASKVTEVAGEDESATELVPEPVLRYSDEPRRISEASLWVWTRNSRPVAFQKVEVQDQFGSPLWTICFASLSHDLVRIDWPENPPYKSRKPGVVFAPIAGAEAPAEKAAARRSQLRSLARRFNGRAQQGEKETTEMRLLPRPFFEYADPETMLPRGAIFGMAAFNTNPDMVLVVEVRPDANGDLRWEFAPVRLTSNGLVLKLDDDEVWTDPQLDPVGGGYDTWHYYFIRRNLPTAKDDEFE